MIKNRIIYNSFTDWKYDFTKAEGSYIWADNKKLIDFTSGWNVTNLGWNHPEITEVIKKHAETNHYTPMWMSDSTQEKYADALVAVLPKELNSVSRVTGGTEANEQAIKIARAATGRKKIIGFVETYHGESLGVMSIGYRPSYVTKIAPLVPEFVQLEYPRVSLTNKNEAEILSNSLTELENVLKHKDVAAVFMEPLMITGWGSTFVAPQGFTTAVRKLTQQYGTLLIIDEVGTGFSRTGKLFGMEHENIVPDIATFAKGISNGAAAIGAVAVKSELVENTLGDTNLTSTFGWTPIACAVAIKVLEIHKRDTIWEQAAEKGAWLMSALKNRLTTHPNVGDVRGLGMEIGLVLVQTGTKEGSADVCKYVVAKAHEYGLHLIYGDNGSIQLMPPLTIPQETLEEGVEILIKSINQIK